MSARITLNQKLDIQAVSMALMLRGAGANFRLLFAASRYCGYMTVYPEARAFVDARVQRIYGGTSEALLEFISRSVLT